MKNAMILHPKLNKKAALLLLGTIALLLAGPLGAQTWSTTPGSGDWNTAGNWNLGVPNSSSSTADFGASSITNVTLSGNISLAALQFDSGAPSYSIDTKGNSLDIYGFGVANGSSSAQTLTNSNNGTLYF